MKIILVPTKRTAQYIEQSVNHVIMLKTYVSSIKKVYQALGAAQSEILTTIREACHIQRTLLQTLLLTSSSCVSLRDIAPSRNSSRKH
jgi:hypothetical protein